MRKPYTKSKPKAKKTSKPATKAIVKSVINTMAETKRVDGIVNIDASLVSPTFYPINNPNLGTDDFQRVGNTINCAYMYFKGNVTFPDTTNKARIMIIMDKQSIEGATPALANLFTFSGQPINSFIQPDSRFRYDVLYDRVYSGGTGGPVTKAVKIYKDLSKYKTVFYGADGTAIRTNALWLVFMSDSQVIAHPVMSGCMRFAYKDG